MRVVRLLIIALMIVTTAEARAQQPPAVLPVSVKDSILAQRKVWERLHVLYRRPNEPHIMEPARERLRVAYRKYQPMIPGDDWLMSLRVGFPINGGPIEPGSAERLPSCLATNWWCSMIHMFLLWQNRYFERAQELLARAFAQMPPQVRCVWGDVSVLIEDEKLRARYTKMGCNERAELEKRLWWLTDPLFSTPGNERMIDHYAREVRLRVGTELKVPTFDGYPWALRITRSAVSRFSARDVEVQEMNPPAGASEAELKKFRGPKGFVQVAFEVMRGGDYRLANYGSTENAIKHTIIGGPIGDVASQPLHFVPASAAYTAPFLAVAEDWDLSQRTRFESGRSPFGPVTALDFQHALFPRGDSARLVVVSEPGSTALLNRALTRAALAYSVDPDSAPVIYREGSQPRYEFSPRVPMDSLIVSLEVLSLERGAGRARFGIAPAPRTGSRLQLSDMLLFRTDSAVNPADVNLEAMLHRAHATTTFARGIKTGIFWEVYGLRSGEQPQFALTATRLASAVPAERLPRPSPSATKARPGQSTLWTDNPVIGNAIEPRQITLDLTQLAAGYYELSLSVTLPGEPVSTVRRRIQITR